MNPAPTIPPIWTERWQRLSAAFLRGFHRYATWLVGISWKRFALLSIALLIIANIVPSLPPFSWRVTETIEDSTPRPPQVKPPPAPPAPPEVKPPSTEGRREPVIKIERPASGAGKPDGLDISIDERGIRITPRPNGAASAASAPEAAADVQRRAERDAHDAVVTAEDATRNPGRRIQRTRQVRWGDFLTDLALLWVLASAIIKATYKGRMQAEVKAAQATETAEAESLRRQVVEARMAAMQAQVEPHFLFNTLASIDHLIETDPQRASQMQKNLIALLRASMPTMREANDGGVRDLARELQVIRPYLEILKVRMEERLSTQIEVPDGLLSAEFPPMMLQTLVENAIQHGLEPKPEGGQLTVRAEIVHGKLQVSVADSGLGFGRAATGGTGVGLANIRERLQLLYGPKAALTVAENPGGGTIVTITVPYRSLGADAA